jgi:hypothetical protein
MVIVLDPHDVVFAEITAGLYFDQFEIDLVRVLEPARWSLSFDFIERWTARVVLYRWPGKPTEIGFGSARDVKLARVRELASAGRCKLSEGSIRRT